MLTNKQQVIAGAVLKESSSSDELDPFFDTFPNDTLTNDSPYSSFSQSLQPSVHRFAEPADAKLNEMEMKRKSREQIKWKREIALEEIKIKIREIKVRKFYLGKLICIQSDDE